MSHRWTLYVADMEEFCRRVLEYRSDLDRATLEADRMRYDAILRNLELIGEAANNLPQSIRDRAPDIPWKPVVSVRHILAHAYFGVDKGIVWDIVDVEVPLLLEALQKLRLDLERESG